MMPTYSFEKWQNPDGTDTPALVKLKEWAILQMKGEFSFDPIVFVNPKGQLIYNWEFGDDVADAYFEPTLLPYFFDEQGIHGHVWVSSIYDIYHFTPSIQTNEMVEKMNSHLDRCPADHALYDRMFELLNTNLQEQEK